MNPAQPRTCGEPLTLTQRTTGTVRVLAVLSPLTGCPQAIQHTLRCAIQTHPEGTEHWAAAAHLAGREPAAVWAAWTRDRQPHLLVEAPCCPVRDPATRARCLIIARHRGAHSWALSGPAPAALTAANPSHPHTAPEGPR